jgi:hypothetical protein
LIATPDECAALALRFQLVQLASLEATIQLRQEPTSSIIVLEGGVIKAQLTQTCVRTAELFTEHVEFNMERAVVVQPQLEEQPLQRTLSNKKNDKPVKKKSKKTSYSYTMPTLTRKSKTTLFIQEVAAMVDSTRENLWRNSFSCHWIHTPKSLSWRKRALSE